MPHVNVKITPENVTAEEKVEIIKGVTELLVNVLDKNPATTFVVIDVVETENCGIAGHPMDTYRQISAAQAG